MTYVPPEQSVRKPPLLALVGEAPGQEEERLGRPFVGSSGRLLDQMLAAAGISRGDCYITNVSKTRPPANNFAERYYDEGNYKFPKKELFGLYEELHKELISVRPKVVVALGAEALKALTPHSAIKTYRGTMIERDGLRIVPTYHPAYILRGMYEERPIVEADLRKAFRQALAPYSPITNFNYEPTFDQAMTALTSRPKRIAIDIETIGTFTRSFGFGWSKYDAISIPFMRGWEHAWTQDQEVSLLYELDKLLRDESVEKVLQNLTYDCTVLAREYGLVINNIVLDTMLAHKLLYPELPMGLDFQCSIYTDHHMYWDYDRSSTVSTCKYNCYDCVVTYECASIHEHELRERGMWDFYQSITNRLVDRLTYVQSRGVKIDLEARNKVKKQTEAKMADTLLRIEKLVGFPVSPNSPKQVAELCYGRWKLPKQIHPKTKKPTTDDDALSILAKKYPVHAGVINDILSYRQDRVLVSTFCDMPLRNGRVVTSYNVGGTVTGRLSSSATPDGFGGNLQNIPRGDFRRAFVADEGKVLIKADLSQAEYRVLIWKARIQRVIKRWLEEPGFNIHMWNASENIYRIPIDQVTKQQYQNAKNGVYGANYGIGPIKVSRMYNIEYQDAKFIIERYHEAVPEIRHVYQAEIVSEIQQTRKIVNPLGRQRLFFGRMDDELYRAAYSHYCQSTVADIISLGLIELVDLGVDVLLQVHDELVVQAPEDAVETTVATMRRCMERPVTIPGNPIPLVIPCEIKVGKNWYDVVDVKKYLENAKCT